MKVEYTKDEIRAEIDCLSNTFDIVRIVDPILCEEYSRRRDNDEFAPSGCFCFEVWNKNERCKNCISALALAQQTTLSKIEFCSNILYFIISRYIIVEGNKYALECVRKFEENYSGVLSNEHKRGKKIVECYQDIRIDPLTGIYNRRYLIEKLQDLMIQARTQKNCHPAVAYIDIDGVTATNNNFGNLAGDALIIAVAKTIMKTVERTNDDFIARVGNDEFIICLTDSSTYKLKKIVDKLSVEISRTNVQNYPQLKPSVSAGIADFTEAKTFDEIMMLADKRLNRGRQTFIK